MLEEMSWVTYSVSAAVPAPQQLKKIKSFKTRLIDILSCTP